MTFIDRHHRKLAIIIAVVSLVFALVWNEANLQIISGHKPPLHKIEPTYRWLITDDDAAYLRPAEHYFKEHVWRDNNPGRQSYFVRTPGYGLFRYALMEVMGFDTSYYYFRYVQVLLFALTVLLLYKTAELSGLPRGYALTVEAIYGLSPFAIGFLYYSLTEGITPALMIGYSYLMLLAYRRSGPFFFLLAAIVMAYIGITRPVLLIFAVALPVMIWWALPKLVLWRRLIFILLCGLIVAAPIGMWAYRSYRIAGENVGIYPIYYAENNSQFRPTHEAIWDFAKSYGAEGRAFHEVMTPLWKATISGDTDEIHIDSVLMATPDYVKDAIGTRRLRTSYHLYRASMIYQRSLYPNGTAMSDTIPKIEREVVRQFAGYTQEINSKYWLRCHVAVPLIVFKRAIFHSNLSLYIFQHDLRGVWWMEAMRYFFLVLHVLCCLSFLYVLFFAKHKAVRLLMGFLVGAYFFYLCYVFRGLEERYTLPVLPLMLVGVFYVVYDIRRRIQNPPAPPLSGGNRVLG